MSKLDIDEIMWVIGIVDAYGAVHSKVIMFEDKDHGVCHGDEWPGNLKRWRWSGSNGLSFGFGERAPDEFDIEERDAIERHLERIGIDV